MTPSTSECETEGMAFNKTKSQRRWALGMILVQSDWCPYETPWTYVKTQEGDSNLEAKEIGTWVLNIQILVS